jgi:hypothetical protein
VDRIAQHYEIEIKPLKSFEDLKQIMIGMRESLF